MNSINFSEGKVGLCHKGNCINVRGDLAKPLTLGITALIVTVGIVSMLESSN